MQLSPNVASRKSQMSGVTLIEVLIAVLVMAIGLLGIGALQATAIRNNQAASERTQAVIQSYAILDAMRANLHSTRNGDYALLSTLTCESGAVDGDDSAMAAVL